MSSVLRRGPWSFNEWMCVVQKWNTNHSDQDLMRIPFWVQIRGIPLHFLTERMVTTIGGRLGHFMETDFGSDGTALVDYVRVRLLWNIEDPLRFQRLFQFGDEASVLKNSEISVRSVASSLMKPRSVLKAKMSLLLHLRMMMRMTTRVSIRMRKRPIQIQTITNQMLNMSPKADKMRISKRSQRSGRWTYLLHASISKSTHLCVVI